MMKSVIVLALLACSTAVFLKGKSAPTFGDSSVESLTCDGADCSSCTTNIGCAWTGQKLCEDLRFIKKDLIKRAVRPEECDDMIGQDSKEFKNTMGYRPSSSNCASGMSDCDYIIADSGYSAESSSSDSFMQTSTATVTKKAFIEPDEHSKEDSKEKKEKKAFIQNNEHSKEEDSKEKKEKKAFIQNNEHSKEEESKEKKEKKAAAFLEITHPDDEHSKEHSKEGKKASLLAVTHPDDEHSKEHSKEGKKAALLAVTHPDDEHSKEHSKEGKKAALLAVTHPDDEHSKEHSKEGKKAIFLEVSTDEYETVKIQNAYDDLKLSEEDGDEVRKGAESLLADVSKTLSKMDDTFEEHGITKIVEASR